MTEKYFVEYTRIEVKHFRDTLLQHMGNVKKSVFKRARHQRQYDRRVNKRLMQTQESKIDMAKAVNDDLVVTESSGTESEVQDENSRLGNDKDADDADIRPIYNEKEMAKVQLNAECNIFAIGQQHTEQPDIINEGRVDQSKEVRMKQLQRLRNRTHSINALIRGFMLLTFTACNTVYTSAPTSFHTFFKGGLNLKYHHTVILELEVLGQNKTLSVYEENLILLVTNLRDGGQVELTILFRLLKMKGEFQMSAMGELTFFLGLQVQQRPDGIFIHQDKYVQEILNKFDLGNVMTATTPYEAPKPKSKSNSDSPVNVSSHYYYFKLEAVKKIFKYLKGQPKLGLWYPKESSLVLKAYSDSDYAGANKDRKSKTGGCVFNESNYIFRGMVSNIRNAKKFLMYPRFLQTILENPMLLLPAMLLQAQAGEGAKVAAQDVPHPVPAPDQSPGHLPTPSRPQSSDSVALVLEHDHSSDQHKTVGTFPTREDALLGGDFHTSPTRSSHAPPTGQPSGAKLHDHKNLSKDVVRKLVKKVKTLEVKLKTQKRKMVVSDSDQEDGTTQNVDLDAIRALTNAAVAVDLDIPSGSTSQIHAASSCAPTAVPLDASSVLPGASGVAPGASGVAPGASDVSPGASIAPTAASAVPADSLKVPPVVPADSLNVPAGVSSKGKSPMVEEDIPVTARTFRQMEKDRLGEEAAKRLHKEEMAHMEREREEAQRKKQQEVIESAMYYNEFEWLNIRAQVEANASLSNTLLGDDNRPLTSAQQKAYMRQYVKNQSSVIYNTGWTMAYVKSFFDEQLKQEFEKIRKVQSHSQIQAFSLTLRRPGSVLEEPSTKRPKSPEAPTSSMTKVPISHAVTSHPSSRTRRKSLGRKHMHKPKSTLPTLDLDALAQTLLKVVVDEDSDDEDSVGKVWSAVVGWEVLPTPLGEINSLYRIDGSTKHFTTLRQILHMESKNWLVQKQTDFGKDISNPLMADNMPKIVRYVVPTGRVIVPTGRYVVPTGRVIVTTGRYIVHAGSDHNSDNASIHNEAPNNHPQSNIQPQIITTVSNNNAKFPYLKKDEYERESKARTTLLQSILDDHIADFHYMDDARDIWNAVKARFGGNVESKKKRKSMLKQEFLEFRIIETEGFHKGYDRMQKILSQLNQLSAKPDTKEIYLRFLRALPSSWSQVALILKTKGGLEFLSFDDLYYKLKMLEVNVRGYSTISPSQSTGLSHSAFKARRKINFDKKESARFNKQKVRCYKCQRRGHFARECRSKKGNDKQRYSSLKVKEIGKKEEDSKALITVDTLVDWSNHDSESDEVITAKEFGMIVGCDSVDAIKVGANKLYNLINEANSEEANPPGNTGEFALIGVTSEPKRVRMDDSAFSVFTTTSEDVEGRPTFHSDKSSEDNTNDLASSDSGLKSSEHKVTDSSCASTSSVSTSVNGAEIDSNYTHLIKDCYFYEKQMNNTTVGPTVRPQPVPTGTPKVKLVSTGKPKATPAPTGRPRGTPVPTGELKATPVPTGKPKGTPVPTGKPTVHPIPTGKPKFTPVPPGIDGQLLLIPQQLVLGKHMEKDNTFLAAKDEGIFDSGCSRSMTDEGIFDSGCSRSMTGNKDRLDDFQAIHSGKVTFRGGEGRITGKGIIRTPTLDFENVYYDFKLPDDNMVVLKVPRKHNLYTINLNDLCPRGNLACLVAHASFNEWIKREYNNPRTLQQNRVAERKNRTLIEAARTMLADFKLPTMFWTEAKRTACCVLNRVSVTSPHNKTSYALLTGNIPTGLGHELYFDLYYLTDSLGYKHVSANQSAGKQGYTTKSAGKQDADSDSDYDKQVIIVPSYPSNSVQETQPIDTPGDKVDDSPFSFVDKNFRKELAKLKDQEQRITTDAEELRTPAGVKVVPPGCIPVPTGRVPVPAPAGSVPVPTGSITVSTDRILVPAGDTMVHTDDVTVHSSNSTDSMFDGEPTTRFPCPSDLGNHNPSLGIFSSSSYDDEFDTDLNNVASSVEVSPVPTKRINTIHP
nr:hypothetical protein [Tanacetum cinerariifolium]